MAAGKMQKGIDKKRFMNAKEFDFGCALTDGIFDKILEHNFVSISREATPKDNFGLNLIKSVRDKIISVNL